MHRPLSVLAVGFLVACTGGTSPFGALSGTWAAYSQPVPGSSQTVTIIQRGDELSGTGAYVLEGGGSGGFDVTGTYHSPQITLRLTRSDGLVFQFAGLVTDNHMAGIETVTIGQLTDSLSYIFTKQ